jgi:hypothetical protein
MPRNNYPPVGRVRWHPCALSHVSFVTLAECVWPNASIVVSASGAGRWAALSRYRYGQPTRVELAEWPETSTDATTPVRWVRFPTDPLSVKPRAGTQENRWGATRFGARVKRPPNGFHRLNSQRFTQWGGGG